MFVHIQYRCNLFPNIFSPWSVDSRVMEPIDTHGQLYMYMPTARQMSSKIMVLSQTHSSQWDVGNGPSSQPNGSVSLPLLSTLSLIFSHQLANTTAKPLP